MPMVGGEPKLSILQINTLDGAGGAAKVAWQLKEGLKKKGHTCRMLVGHKITEDPDVANIPTLEAKSRWIRYANRRVLKRASSALSIQYLDIFNSFGIRRRKDFADADIVHFHNLHGDYLSPLALPGLTKSKKAVYTLHDMWAITGHCAHSFACERWITGCGQCPDLKIYPALKHDTTRLLLKIKKRIYQRSNFVIVVPSIWLREKALKSVLREKEIKLIYNGVDETIFHPMNKKEARQKLGLPQNKIILACSSHGGIHSAFRSRNHLLSALREVSQHRILFLNIGSSETLEEKAEPPTECLSIPHVHQESTMAEYLAASDIFLYPTLADNCPLGVLEAMACGLPVVSFDVGGVPELVDHGKTGYIAESENSHDLALGVKYFIENAEAREKAGQLARIKVEKWFTLDRMVQEYLDVYGSLLKNDSLSSPNLV